jgi:5-oxoprolinase (ATP-hydrolysing) subunit C
VGLSVVNPGLYTTVQDAGRTGYREWGVPGGGAFDVGSYELANALLGNPAGASAIELTMVGGTFEAETSLGIALTGAPMEAAIQSPGGGSRSLQIPQTATLAAGERLVLGGTGNGVRTYLAVKGGWQTPLILGSRSSELPLKASDNLPAARGTVPVRRPSHFASPPLAEQTIRIVDGPDAGRWIEPGVWESMTFRLGSQSNRMGLRLEGPSIDVAADPERISTPVAPGTVQVAGGQLIILGVACGTMGGYPHLAHVISADLDLLGQARPGDRIRLHRIELSEAREIDRATRAERAAQIVRTTALATEPPR